MPSAEWRAQVERAARQLHEILTYLVMVWGGRFGMGGRRIKTLQLANRLQQIVCGKDDAQYI